MLTNPVFTDKSQPIFLNLMCRFNKLQCIHKQLICFTKIESLCVHHTWHIKKNHKKPMTTHQKRLSAWDELVLRCVCV